MQTLILDSKEENIAKCARYIARGGVVAFPTETVYGLGADAFNADAVKEIFRVKGRPSDNPLIVHVCSARGIREVAENISPLAEKLISEFMPGALTLVLKKKKGLRYGGARYRWGANAEQFRLPRVFARMRRSDLCAERQHEHKAVAHLRATCVRRFIRQNSVCA